MAKDELKNLPPEERIKKLKELQEKRKKEIAEAREQIIESETELTERRKWEDKVPIPELAQEDLVGLSEEAKEILKQQKGLKEKAEPEDESASEEKTTEVSLEETLGKEEIAMPRREQALQQDIQQEQAIAAAYQPFSEKPIGELYQAAAALQETVVEKGYVSLSDEQEAEYLTGVIEDRIRASEEGKYSFTEDTAKAASFIKSVGSNVQNVYRTSTQRDLYKEG